MWHELLNRLHMLVMRGRVQLVDDTKAAQLMQVKVSSNWTQDVPRLAEYGLHSNPPAGADVVMLFMAGNPTDGIVIATGHQQYRLHLQPGEVALSDDQGQVVKLSRTGIEIAAPQGVSITGDVAIAGNLTVAGDTTFIGQVSANGKRIDNTHKHTGVAAGGANSGTVL